MSGGPGFREKLVKVLAMLSSTHDGEVLAAARLSSAMVREASLTWADLIVSSTGPTHGYVSNHKMAAACLSADRDTAVFDVDESQFLRLIASQLRRHHVLSQKDRDRLRSLYQRAAAARTAA